MDCFASLAMTKMRHRAPLFRLIKPIYNAAPDRYPMHEGNPVSAKINPLAGKPADPSMLANIPRLVTAYFAGQPDPSVPSQRVSFGTSGHRGSALNHAFNEAHIVAISQALCDHRQNAGVSGPLFVGIDTHALAEPALASALEVFAANDVEAMIDERGLYADTGRVACDPDLQQEPHERSRRR